VNNEASISLLAWFIQAKKKNILNVKAYVWNIHAIKMRRQFVLFLQNNLKRKITFLHKFIIFVEHGIIQFFYWNAEFFEVIRRSQCYITWERKRAIHWIQNNSFLSKNMIAFHDDCSLNNNFHLISLSDSWITNSQKSKCENHYRIFSFKKLVWLENYFILLPMALLMSFTVCMLFDI
jgi:hypothetical protein